MSKILWLDVDGVLLDWTRPFLKFWDKKEKYEDLYQYDISNLFECEDPVKAMVQAIQEFNESEEYENLEPLVSKEDLERLKKFGYRLRVITQVDGKYSRELRTGNLNKAFGKKMFDKIVFTGRGESKAELLRKMYPYDIISIVEDKPGFFSDAARVGGFKPMAILHPYNREELKSLHGFPIYTGMAEVVRHLCSY